MRSDGNNKSKNRCTSRRKKRSGFKNSPDNLLEVIVQVPNYKGVSGARNNKWSNNKCKNGGKSTCCGESMSATIATFGKGPIIKLVFAIVRILAKTATSGRLSY